jgi:hypothetical protein
MPDAKPDPKQTPEDREPARLAAIQASHDREPTTSEVLTRVVRLERILESESGKSLAELHEKATAPAKKG